MDGACRCGSVHSNTAPCSGGTRLVAVMSPPCACTMARQMARPSPTPGALDSFSPRLNLRNKSSASPFGKPGPLSATVTRIFSPISFAPNVMGVPGGVYLAAFSNRFTSTRSSSTPSPYNNGRSAGNSTRTGCAFSAEAIERIALPANSSSDCQSRFKVIVPLCRRAMSSKLLTNCVMRSACVVIASASICSTESCRASASASVSDMPISAVNGVRKSCDSAASSELRSRSVSIASSVSCATDTKCTRSTAMAISAAYVSSNWRCSGIISSRGLAGSTTITPRVRMGAFSGT